MLKLTLIVIILLSSYLFGVNLSKRIDERGSEIEEMISALNELKRQVCLFQNENSVAFYKAFGMHSIDEFKNKIIKKKIYASFSEDEKRKIFDFLINFGYGTVTLETKKCEDCISYFCEILNLHNQNKVKRKKLYKTVTLSFGLIISVLVI